MATSYSRSLSKLVTRDADGMNLTIGGQSLTVISQLLNLPAKSSSELAAEEDTSSNFAVS